MIISASRRTDIPALYSEWFINRIRAGFCTVPNPFNRKQVSRVPLGPRDIDVIVFWTRYPRPLFQHLPELDDRGYRYYFQYTLMDNPRALDQKVPSHRVSVETFRELADQIGPERMIWRYDPIVFSNLTSASFHQETYERIASELCGYTHRSIISIVDMYSKTQRRAAKLKAEGVEITPYKGTSSKRFDQLMAGLVHSARENKMEIFSCAEDLPLEQYGIRPGKCVDDELISRIFGIAVTTTKDSRQREVCHCVLSKDIGMYDTCLFGCQYCYAVNSFKRARLNYQKHDPKSPSLVGWYDLPADREVSQQPRLWQD